MKRLEWTETKHGWRSDPYQIELVAPGFWVLTRRPDHSRWPSVLASGRSMKGLRKWATRFEARKQGRRRLISYLAWLLAAIVLATAARSTPALLFPAVVGVLMLALRVIGFWVGMATDRGWNRMADIYQ